MVNNEKVSNTTDIRSKAREQNFSIFIQICTEDNEGKKRNKRYEN
jgi:hypothetical protein